MLNEPILNKDELEDEITYFSHFHSGSCLIFYIYSFILFPIFHLLFIKICYAECIDIPDLGTQAKNMTKHNEYTKERQIYYHADIDHSRNRR